MEGFTKFKKVQCFKEGSTVQRQIANFEKRERKVEEKDDVAQDKKVVKKAFSIHDKQQHEEKTDLSKLKKGGRAKKEKGTVKKFCGGKSVKKMADGGSVFDDIKAGATKLKENILGTEEQNKIGQATLDKQATEGSKLAKLLGGRLTEADAASAAKAKGMKKGGKTC